MAQSSCIWELKGGLLPEATHFGRCYGESNVVDAKHTSESHILKLFIDFPLMEREDCLYLVLSFRKGKSQKLCFVLCNLYLITMRDCKKKALTE